MKSGKVSSSGDMLRFILISFLGWRVLLELIARFTPQYLTKQTMFLGPIPWANFDGVHYLSIAERGYVQYEQAFFPLYPVLIRFIGRLFHQDFVLAAMLISHLSFIGSLIFLWKLIPLIPSLPKDKIPSIQKWTIVFTLAFPTSYYFASVYTESLFLFLILPSFYFFQKKRYVFYGIGASITSGVRLVGSFLLVPVGLFAYMTYLWKQYGDPLLFMHVQPAFGANRSGSELVILPQVLWRYLKIFIKVPARQYDWWIALFELFCFILSLLLLWIAWRRKYPRAWVYFSLASIIVPTLTGTLSSMPRYVLVAFPLYIVLAQMPKALKIGIFIVSVYLLIIGTLLFTHGYWIA